MPDPTPLPWTTEIWLRMRRHFLIKLVGTSLFIGVFFLGYFHLLRFPQAVPLVMPLTPLDALVPFQPAMLLPYLTLWFYVGIAPGLQRRFDELVVYGLWAAALCGAGLACFYLWPTAVPPLRIDVSAMAGFDLLKGVDASGNACPSMHVAIAIFTAIRLEQVLRDTGVPWPWRALNAAWFLAIAWATLAIRQHVVIDVAAGALLGAVFAAASLRWRPAPGVAGALAAPARRPADIIRRSPKDAAP